MDGTHQTTWSQSKVKIKIRETGDVVYTANLVQPDKHFFDS